MSKAVDKTWFAISSIKIGRTNKFIRNAIEAPEPTLTNVSSNESFFDCITMYSLYQNNPYVNRNLDKLNDMLSFLSSPNHTCRIFLYTPIFFLATAISVNVIPINGIASNKSIPYRKKSTTGCIPNNPKLPSKKHSAALIVCGI